MADATNGKSEGRDKVSQRFFIDESGERAPRVMEDVVGAEIVFLADDQPYETVKIDFTELNGFADLPKGSVRMAAAWGIITNVMNTTGSASLSVDEKIEAVERRLEVITADRWSTERDSGPRTSYILEAICRVQEALGKPLDEATRAQYAEALASGKIVGADLLKHNARVKAAHDAIKAEAAIARAEKSASKADSEPEQDLASLL